MRVRGDLRPSDSVLLLEAVIAYESLRVRMTNADHARGQTQDTIPALSLSTAAKCARTKIAHSSFVFLRAMLTRRLPFFALACAHRAIMLRNDRRDGHGPQ